VQKQCNIFVKGIIVLGKDEEGNGTGRPVVVVCGVCSRATGLTCMEIKSGNRRFLGCVGDERLLEKLGKKCREPW
jgi:hypothetical protein